MNACNIFSRNGLRLALVAAVALTGCVATQAPSAGADADGADGMEQSPPQESPRDNTVVTVRFVNETQEVVETLFYATNEPVASLPDALFQPANLITVGIGVAGRGLLIPRSADTIEVPCTESLVLGTTGGSFQDADDGTELGQGPQRWLQAGAVFDCGAAITFTYKTEGNDYTTDVAHESAD